MATKYYQSNLRGTFRVDGVGEVPPPPSYLKTDDAKKQKILDNHSRNGHRVGFSEVPKPEPVKSVDSKGNPKKAKPAKSGKAAEPKGKEVDADAYSEPKGDSGVLHPDDVTNAQLAKKYLLDNFADKVDGRTLTTADKIREAADGLAEFPNWEAK